MSQRDKSLKGVEKLVDQIAEQERRLEKMERAGDLTHSAIDSGGISIKDENGNVAVQIGTNADGSVTTNYVSGPKPNAPSLPLVSSGFGTLLVTWDGLDVDGHQAPSDFLHLAIYASLEEDFDPDVNTFQGVITSREGGSKTIGLPYGTYFISTAVITLSGNRSDFTPPIKQDILSAIEMPDIAEEFGADREALANLDVKLDSAETDLADAQARIESAENQLTDLGLDADAIRDRLATAEGNLADHSAQASQDIQALQQNLATNTTQLSDARTRLAEAEATLNPLPGALQAVQQESATAKLSAQEAAQAAIAAQAAAAEANARAMTMIPNGSFEDGLTYWSTTEAPGLSTDSHSGSQSAVIGLNKTVSPESLLSAIPGQILELQFFYKANNASAVGAQLLTSFYDSTGEQIIEAGWNTKTDASQTAWKTSGPIRFTVPLGLSQVSFKIGRANAAPTDAEWLIDDVTLRDVTDVVRLEQAASQAAQKAQEAKNAADALALRADALELSLGGLQTRLTQAETDITNAASQAGVDLTALEDELRQAFTDADALIIAEAERLKLAQDGIDTRLTTAEGNLADATAQAEADISTLGSTLRQEFATADSQLLATAQTDAQTKADQALADANLEAQRLANSAAQTAADEAEQAAKDYADLQASGASADALQAAKLYAEQKAAQAESAAKAVATTAQNTANAAMTRAGEVKTEAIAEAQRLATAAQAEAVRLAELDATTKANAAKSSAELAAATEALRLANIARDEAIATGALDATDKAEAARLAAESVARAEAKAKADAAQAEAVRLAGIDATNKANTARTAAEKVANDLPKVFHSASAPTGSAPDQSIWFQHFGSVSGPVIAQWTRTGGQWVSTPIRSEAIANLDVGKLTAGSAVMATAVIEKFWADLAVVNRLTAVEAWIGGAQIKDGEITAPKLTVTEEMVVNILGVKSAVADVLSVNEQLWAKRAVIDQLFTNMFTAKKITAEQMVIHPGNIFPDPEFQHPDGYPGWTVVNGGIERVGSATQAGAYPAHAEVNVTPGDVFRIEATRTNVTGSGGQATIHYNRWDEATSKWVYGGQLLPMTQAGLNAREWTVPVGVNKIRLGFFLEATVATGTKVRIDKVRILPMTTSVLIKDGSVTANHITASESLTTKVLGAKQAVIDALTVNDQLWAQAAQIITLDVGNLTVTGTSHLDTAVANRLFADIFAANKVTANEIIVPPNNLVADPTFGDDKKYWTGAGTVFAITDHPINGAGKALRFTPNGTNQDAINSGNNISTVPGEQFHVEAWVKVVTQPTTHGQFGIGARANLKSGHSWPIFLEKTDPAKFPTGVWKKISGTITMPANTTSLTPIISVRQNGIGGQLLITGMTLKPVIGGVLIGDNQVTASHIVASESLTTKVLAAEEAVVNMLKVNLNLWAEAAQIMKLDVTNLIASNATIDEAVITRLWTDIFTAKKITSDQIDVNELWADRVWLNALEASEAKFTSKFGEVETTVNGKGLTITEKLPDGDYQDLVKLTGESVERVTIHNSKNDLGDVYIDDSGTIAGASGTFQELSVGGESIHELLRQMPRGIVDGSLAWRNLGTKTIDGATNYGFLQWSFQIEKGRVYRMNLEPFVSWDRGSGTTYLDFRYTLGSSVPMLTSDLMWRQASNVSPDTTGLRNYGGNWFLRPQDSWFTGDETTKDINFLLCLNGTNVVDLPASSVYNLGEVTVWAEDIGPAISTTSVDREEITMTPSTPAPTPTPPPTTVLKSVTQTWESTGVQAFNSNGTKYLSGRMYQGVSPHYTTGGIKNAHAIFGTGNKGQTLSQAGASVGSAKGDVKKIEAYLYYEHWHYNDGGTSSLSWHSSTSIDSRPTYNHIKNVAGWKRKEGKWVDITSTATINAFKAGTLRGIAINPGSTSPTSYGYASGSGSTRPKLRITYTTK